MNIMTIYLIVAIGGVITILILLPTMIERSRKK